MADQWKHIQNIQQQKYHWKNFPKVAVGIVLADGIAATSVMDICKCTDDLAESHIFETSTWKFDMLW